MFTGLIEAVGRITDVGPTPAGFRLRIGTDLAPTLQPSESVSVNGVCLTVTVADDSGVHADIGPETARITTLGTLRSGHVVNLERAMRADGRFGGHFVQGHVDGTGVVEEVRADGDAHWLTVTVPAALTPYVIRKGSIAIDGVSLTVADLAGGRVSVMLIPFTWTHTNLHALGVGDRVNIECDMLGKYVVHALDLRATERDLTRS